MVRRPGAVVIGGAVVARAPARLQTDPDVSQLHAGQLENVLTALETGGDVAITGEDGRRTIELITAIYKAGSEHRTAVLPLAADDPFYTVEGIRANVPHFYEKTVSIMEQAGEMTFGSDFRYGGKG